MTGHGEGLVLAAKSGHRHALGDTETARSWWTVPERRIQEAIALVGPE